MKNKILNIINNVKWDIPFLLLLILSIPIWIPISCYKIGLVFSDIVVKKFVKDA